jgi:hypothetical protein
VDRRTYHFAVSSSGSSGRFRSRSRSVTHSTSPARGRLRLLYSSGAVPRSERQCPWPQSCSMSA